MNHPHSNYHFSHLLAPDSSSIANAPHLLRRKDRSGLHEILIFAHPDK
jgi:hypothetical protein